MSECTNLLLDPDVSIIKMVYRCHNNDNAGDWWMDGQYEGESHRLPTLFKLSSLASIQRPLSLPFAPSKALISDACPSSVLSGD